MKDPFRTMPFPGSGANNWRMDGGELVPDVPAPPIEPIAPAPLRKPTKTSAAPRRTRKAKE